MFCKNCGTQQKDYVKFCPNCGQQININTIIARKAEPIKVEDFQKTKSLTTSEKIVRFVSIMVAFIIGKFLGPALLILLIPYFIGEWFPIWYLSHYKINFTMIKWIAWSNVLTWLLPPLGILTGFSAFGLRHSVTQESKKYKMLAIIGISLSLINAITGIIMRM